jgi:hypothetical protein
MQDKRSECVITAFDALKSAAHLTGYRSQLYWSGLLRYFVKDYPSKEQIDNIGLVKAWEILLTEKGVLENNH